jgi:hypothetical protein
MIASRNVRSQPGFAVGTNRTEPREDDTRVGVHVLLAAVLNCFCHLGQIIFDGTCLDIPRYTMYMAIILNISINGWQRKVLLVIFIC